MDPVRDLSTLVGCRPPATSTAIDIAELPDPAVFDETAVRGGARYLLEP